MSLPLLTQQGLLQPKQRFELREGGELHVAVGSRSSFQEFIVDLRNLTDRTMVSRRSAVAEWSVGWLLLLGYFATVAGMGYSMRKDSDALSSTAAFALLMAFVFFPFAIAVFAKAMKGSYDLTVFFFRRTGEAAFSVSNRKPDCTTVQQFIESLKNEIVRAAPMHMPVEGGGVAAEITQLQELRTRGVLTEAEFVAAKQRLLGMGAEDKRMGFR